MYDEVEHRVHLDELRLYHKRNADEGIHEVQYYPKVPFFTDRQMGEDPQAKILPRKVARSNIIPFLSFHCHPQPSISAVR
jgi:hypothetical protein